MVRFNKKNLSIRILSSILYTLCLVNIMGNSPILFLYCIYSIYSIYLSYFDLFDLLHIDEYSLIIELFSIYFTSFKSIAVCKTNLILKCKLEFLVLKDKNAVVLE